MSVPVPCPVRRRALRVALISMPMAAVQRPSIQIGLLAAIGRRRGHDVETMHASIDFARWLHEAIGPVAAASVERAGGGSGQVADVLASRDVYSLLAQSRGAMVGEWLFAAAAFGADVPTDAEELLDDHRIDDSPIGDLEDALLLRIREEIAPQWVDGFHAHVDWSRFDVVGFSCTFEQSCASLALARRIKASHPRVLTLFGGANVEGDMGVEIMRSMPWVDLAVRGEADQAFPDLLDVLALGGDVCSVRGVIGRSASTPSSTSGDDGSLRVSAPAVPIDDLEAQPEPVYDEYFDRLEATGLLPRAAHRLLDVPFESARGCWWGAKRHCTFCGLNGQTMRFRSKSADRVRHELASLAKRHGSFRFTATDNIIEQDYLTSLLPSLEPLDFDLFYEIKADVSRRDLEALARAGVRRVQPGIESLSSRVLGLMRKGTRASWNVNVLRWSLHLGIDVSWNLLWGFPGESAEDYAEQAVLVPRLVHLQPPSGHGRVWLERFSPLVTDTERFVIEDRQPDPSYARIYPNHVDLERLAYFFAGHPRGALGDEAYTAVAKAANTWQRAWSAGRSEAPELVVRRAPGHLRIEDRRVSGKDDTHTLSGVGARLYEACMDAPRTAASVAEELGVGTAPVEAALDAYCDAGITMRDRTLYLSLAVPPRRG